MSCLSFKHRHRAVLGALFLSCTPSWAAEPSADAAADARTVVVTATRFSEADPRIAANISVLTREDLAATPGLDLPTRLRYAAGVDVRSLYGSLGIDTAIDLRGFGETANSNTLVLIDGQRLNPIDMGSISWSAIPVESIERVEIIRGAGTVLYGDRASGGVINIVTDKSGAPRAAVTVSAGSFDHRGVDAHAGAGNETGYFNVFAHQAQSRGWRDNSQQDQLALSGRAGLHLTRGEVFLDWAAYQDSSGLPGSLLSAPYHDDPRQSTSPHDRQRRQGHRLRPGVRLALHETLQLEAEYSDEREDQRAHYISSNFHSDRQRKTRAFTPRLRWQHGLGSLSSETVFGYDYHDGDLDARSRSGPRQKATQTSRAFYAQNITQLSDAWTLTLGARSQQVRQGASQEAWPAWFYPAMDGDATRRRTAWDLGLSHQQDSWRIWGKLGTTFRFANVDELFGQDPLLFIPVFAGDLRPQHGRTAEIGGRVEFGALRAQASVYRLMLRDEIGYDGALGANVNFDPTRRQGLDLELDWQISERWRSKFAYAYLDAKFRDGPYAGRRVPLAARNKLSLQLLWDAGRAGNYALALNHVGQRPYSGDFDNAQGRLAAYTTVDLQAAWAFKPWTLSAQLLNAFDKRYAAYAGYSPWAADHYYYPADGRSIHLSARIDF